MALCLATAAGAVTAVCALVFASTASASGTLGSTAVPSGSAPAGCPSGFVVYQATSDPSTPYSVPAGGGVITQWQTNTTGATAGAPVTFLVLKPNPGGLSYNVVGVDKENLPSPLPLGNVATFTLSTPIAVSGGETLGLWTSGPGAVCDRSGSTTPAADTIGRVAESTSPAVGQTLPFSGTTPPGTTMNVAATLASPPPTSAQCVAATGLACYSPQQLQRAYNLGPLYAKGFNGFSSTIVIVDPFGSPTIGKDLSVFDHFFNLPNPPVFRVLQPVGQVPPFSTSNNEMVLKAGETTLDVEWAHAIAPRANILVVETPTMELGSGAGFQQLMGAEDYVIRHRLGGVISQSFSLPEQNFGGRSVIFALRKTYIRARRNRITVLAASNDNGVSGPMPNGQYYDQRVVQWPATDPLVTAVGGTRLQLDAAGNRTSPDVAWNDTWDPFLQPVDHNVPPPVPWSSSGGLSVIFPRPAFQRSLRHIVHGRRGVPDISMSASLSGAVLTFSSYLGTPAWNQAGGTSEATPEFAGIVAIANQYARKRFHKQRLGLINPALYELSRRHLKGIVDVTSGNNTVSFHSGGKSITTVVGYSATRGYDLVTGLGTIDAARFIPTLAKLGS